MNRNQNKVTLLLVDDEYVYVNTLIRHLENESFRILQANNGQMACEVATKFLPDIIIMDWDMPIMNGIEATHFLKAQDSTKDIPIIMASGMMTSVQHLETSFKAGAVDFIRKPVDQLELKARINSILKLSQSYKKIKEQAEEISKQKAALEEQNQRMVELIRMKEALTGMIIHDLKNPLNAIINRSNDVTAIQASRQMHILVNNILDVQKFEEAKVELKIESVNISEVVTSAIKQVDFLYIERNIEFKSELEENLVVQADPEILNRILVNLLSNAAKYNLPNGSVAVEGFLQESGNAHYAKIMVKDTGAGITNNRLPSIFDKYSMFAKNEKERGVSSGLGLNFCKMAVQAHGGQIGVESTLGRGSVFWFTMPVDRVSLPSGSKIITIDPIIQKSELKLDRSDREMLLPHFDKLKKLNVYQLSELSQVLNEVKQQNTENLQKWSQMMQNAINLCNEELFNDLVKLIKAKN